MFGALERLRTTFRWKCADLDAVGLTARTASSSLTLGGLLKHLAVQEDFCFQVKILGESMPAPWDMSLWDTQGDDWEFDSARHDSPEDLHALFDDAVRRSDAVVDEALARGGLDAESARVSPRTGERFSLRWILVHMIEEYSRHNGHADLIRQSIDGQTGE